MRIWRRFSLWALIRSKLTQISLSFLCLFIILSAVFFHDSIMGQVINRLDSAIYDRVMKFYFHGYKELARVVIIDIDDLSLSEIGRWPWPRDKLASLFSKLQEAGVVVVGVDIIMSDPEVNYAIDLRERLKSELSNKMTGNELSLLDGLAKIAPQVDNDQALARSMKNYDVTLGFFLHEVRDVKIGMLPQPLTNDAGHFLNSNEFNVQKFYGYNASLGLLIEASGHGGFVTNLPDADGVIRHGLILASINNKVYPSLALMTSMRYLLADHVNLKMRRAIGGDQLYGIDIGGTFIPTNARGQVLIPFWGPQFTLPYFSAVDVLRGKVPNSQLSGAIAIVGSSSMVLRDLHASPVAKLFPGVEMVGNMVAAILGQQISTQYDWRSIEGIVIICFLGILFSFLLPCCNVMVMLIVSACLIVAFLSAPIILFFYKNIYIPTGSILLLIVLQTLVNYSYQFFLEKRQKNKIKNLFGQYVPESYVKELIESSNLSMEGQTREMTVLFSDIRGFTNTSEGLDAVGVKRLLNEFFTPLTEIIFNHQGTIDKYVGDMVIAFWGAPIPTHNQEHARQGILAALNIFKQLPVINEHMKAQNLPEVNVGIGLGTGLMNVGDMGSKFRRAYTVLGDVVNLTSRLESLTSFYGVKILVNETTRENQNDFLWRTIDKVAVKGRKASLTISEPLGLIEEISAERHAEIDFYHNALEYYYKQDWDKALSLFETLRQQHPGTTLYQLYYQRIHSYKETPPTEYWDGVYIHTKK